MNISPRDLLRIAKLARLKFYKIELEKINCDFADILSWMDKLREINTCQVKPLNNLFIRYIAKRKDIRDYRNNMKTLTMNTYNCDKHMFYIPKVVEAK